MCVCVHMNVLFVHLSDTHKGNKHRQNDRPRCEEKVVFLLMCHGSWPQAALSQPVHYYCTWPLCALGDRTWQPLTKLPRSSYICLVCHSETQPCQRKFTACTNDNLNATFQHSGAHQALFNKRFICARAQIWSQMSTWAKSVVSYQTEKSLTIGLIAIIQIYLAPSG